MLRDQPRHIRKEKSPLKTDRMQAKQMERKQIQQTMNINWNLNQRLVIWHVFTI